MNRPPAFFKVYIAEINNNDLKIPQAFMQRVSKAFPEKVYLRDRWNNVWPVKVAQVGDDWCLLDGWVKFVEENFLTSGDILVFEYFCDSLFNVKLYGLSATEKATEKNVTGSHIHKDGEKQDHQVSEEEYYDDEEKTESENYDYVFKRRERDNYEDESEEEEETADGNYVLVKHQEHEHEVREQADYTDAVATNGNKPGRQTNYSGKCYGMEIFQAGLAEQPINPYFVTRIMPKRRGDLFVPMDLLKFSNLDFTQEMVLVDPKGRKFHAKCKRWKDGRIVIAGGWRSLCRLNSVQQDDKCICEFVQEEGRCLSLNVSIVRAGDGH